MPEKQDDVIQLSFRDAVRQRSGMYIGSTENPSVCLREIVDNSIDECYVSKSCNRVFIFNNSDSAVVIDNGRGIPIKKMKDADITMAKSSIISAHSGSKFNKDSAQVGMNGIGSSAVNMLSKKYILVVKIDDQTINESTNDIINKFNAKRSSNKGQLFYVLICETGIVKSEDVINFEELKNLVPEVNDANIIPGTLVKFYPDPEIFDEVKMSIPSSLRYFKYISKITHNKNVEVFINGEQYKDNFEPYKYEVTAKVVTNQIYGTPKNKEATFLFSMEFDEDFDHYSNAGSVNGLSVNQGYHIWLSTQAFKKAYEKVFPGFDYKGNEVKGINFCTIMLCAEPSFSSQTKERMSGCPGIDSDCIEPLVSAIVKVIKKNFTEFSVHQKKVVEYNLKMGELSKIEYIKSKVPIIAEVGERRTAAMTPVKLRRCTTKNREDAELFLCEGLSAEGSLAINRDPRIHASIPLRGRPKNAACSTVEQILENQELRDIIAAIGTGIDDYFNLDKIQYGKIILVADADPDGKAIAALLIGLFLAHMKYLIKEGMVYVCDTPLYEQGGNLYYLGDEDKLDKNKPIRRFKGLGELPDDIVKKSIFDANSRKLIRVTMEEADEALSLVVSTYARKQLMLKSGIINEN